MSENIKSLEEFIERLSGISYDKKDSKVKMKKRFLTTALVIIHCSMLIFSACTIDLPPDKTIPPVVTPPIKLDTPTNLRFVGTVAYWNSVSYSIGYVLLINGNTYEVNATQYDFSSLSEIVSGSTYPVKVKAKGNGTTFFDSDFSIENYYTHVIIDSNPNGDSTEIDTSLKSSIARYDIVAAPQYNDLPIIIDSVTDGLYNYYRLDIGYIKNVPIYSCDFFYYEGGPSPRELLIEKYEVDYKKVENAISKTVSESIQETSMNEAGGKIGVEVPLWAATLSAEANY